MKEKFSYHITRMKDYETLTFFNFLCKMGIHFYKKRRYIGINGLTIKRKDCKNKYCNKFIEYLIVILLVITPYLSKAHGCSNPGECPPNPPTGGGADLDLTLLVIVILLICSIIYGYLKKKMR